MNQMTTVDTDKALIVLPDSEDQAALMTLFTGDYEVTIAPLLKHIGRAVTEFQDQDHDPKTEAGRKAIGKFDYRLARSKTALDNAGKTVVTVLKEMPKKIDANRKRARELIEMWQRDISEPLVAWEDAETIRKDRHLAAIAVVATLGANTEGRTAAELRAALAQVEAQVVDASCEEFIDEYRLAKASALARLTAAVAAREKADAEYAELVALRAQAAEREAREAEERRVREAKEREERQARESAERFARERRTAIESMKVGAEVEHVTAAGIRQRIVNYEAMELLPAIWGDHLGDARLAYDKTIASLRASLTAAEEREAAAKAEQDEQAAKLAIEAAERRRLEDEARARREADEEAAQRTRIAEAQRKSEEAAAALRAENEEHRRTFNRETLAVLCLLLPGGGAAGNMENAKAILTAIVRGAVPHLKMEY